MSAYTEPLPDDATLARGRRHVVGGLAVAAAPIATLLAFELLDGTGPDVRLLAPLLLTVVIYAAALLQGSVVARWLAFAATCMLSMLAVPTFLVGLASGEAAWAVLGAVLLVMTAGFALTWVTRPARAWHAARDRRRAERRAHRARRLADWRAAAAPSTPDPHA